ncbi:MAG: hypothetical protein M1829_006719 [Trizodia sp. TS-e1964]|nr:MAG: hypothetical protein M1829_006719 [Trizodia sp. TS-e1964]
MTLKKEAPALSAYELQRQANIASNQALLQELSAASTQLALSLAPPKSGTSTTKKQAGSSRRTPPAKKQAPKEPQPRRTSSRLAGLPADSEGAKRKADEFAALQVAERAKRVRVGGELKLTDVGVAGRAWDGGGLGALDGGGSGAVVWGRAAKDEDEEDEAEGKGEEGLEALRERMGSMKLYERFEPNRIRITPERVYTINFHPTEEKALIFAGDKVGNLGLFDTSQQPDDDDDNDDEDADADPALSTFKIHTRPISALHICPTTPTHLHSASYDASVRRLDLSTGISTELYHPPPTPASDESTYALSGLAIAPSTPSILHLSTLSGLFLLHDTRTNPSKGTTTHHLSDKKIGGFALHPRAPHLLATASLDRTLRIWDLRHVRASPASGTRPALLGTHESRLSVSHAAWDARGTIATTSYDDTIKLHAFPAAAAAWSAGATAGTAPFLSEEAMRPAAVIDHNNQTGRWVTILRPQWQLAPVLGPPRFCVGNMARGVDVYSARGRAVVSLGGEGVSAVPAAAAMHPTREWVVGGTASGKLCLWT